MLRFFSILCLLNIAIIGLYAQNYYEQGLVYEQLYSLSLDIQGKLYKTFYMDRQLDQKFPPVLYFYGRILQEYGKYKPAGQYFKRFQPSQECELSPKVAQIAEQLYPNVQANPGILETFLQEAKKTNDVQVLSTLIIFTTPQNYAWAKECYQHLAGIKNTNNTWESILQQSSLALYAFYSNPNENSAKEVLKITIPQIRYERNFFYDPIYYKHLANASFYLGTNGKNIDAVRCNLKIQQIEQAKKIYTSIQSTLPLWQQSCLAMAFQNNPSDEVWMEWVSQYQEKFTDPIAQVVMLETLLSVKQIEIASQCLTTELSQSQDLEQRVWAIQFAVGDTELRDKLREVVDNWWSKFGVEEETPLAMIQLSRCLLGDNFITPHVRRILSNNNPFHEQSKLMKDYNQAKVIRSTFLLYVAGGRQ